MSRTTTIVSIADIAEATRQREKTVRAWKLRGHMPKPDYDVSGRPGWKTATIQPFIDRYNETGSPRADGKYANMGIPNGM